MSRVGKKPISVPGGVDVKIAGNRVSVKGSKGTLERTFSDRITIGHEDGSLTVTRGDDERESRALHGLSRALLNNMVVGVSDGFSRELNIVGVGYRAILKGRDLELQLGFSHPVTVDSSRGRQLRGPRADQGDHFRHRQRSSGSNRGRHSPTPTTGALQRQGDPLQRRIRSTQGGQGREAMSKNRLAQRRRRHFRVRKSVIGDTSRPRLAVYRSNRYIYAQVIDDSTGRTLAAASSQEADLRSRTLTVDTASEVGKLVASRAKAAGVEAVVFDRGGFAYHGRLKALADAARESGLDF